MKIVIVIIALLVIALFPVNEACGGRGACRTGPMRQGNTITSCVFYEVKPAALVMLDKMRIFIPFFYSRYDQCDELPS